MLIPVEVESANAFILRAREVLARPDTHLYVDTSLVMWLTAVGPTSRSAFLDWASTIGDRIHVPAWTIQEYYRHHRSRTLVTDVAEKCFAAEKAVSEFSVHMRIYADGPLVANQPEMAFIKELDDVRERAAKAIKIARSWNYEDAAAEVIAWMNDRALAKTRAFDSFDQLKRRGNVRYGHQVPPGFEDAHKQTNRYGDLIFWDDVVADARERHAPVVVVLTKDRKKDWFFSRPASEVGEDLKRLRGMWDPVPVPHPMLSFEMRSCANAEILLIDELYLGAIMWSTDKQRFGRLAAVSFGMNLDRLAAEIAPPPSIAARAAKRAADDTTSLQMGMDIVKAAKATQQGAPVANILASLEGEAPAVEEAIEGFTPERTRALSVEDIAGLSRRLYEGALSGPSAAAAFARRLLNSVDQMDASRASAIVGGMLVGAYLDNGAPRDRPVGQLLQEVFEWRVDPGIARTVAALKRDLKRLRSPALYLPSPNSNPIQVRIVASGSNTTTPVAVGQIYVGLQAVLVETASEPALLLTSLMGGAKEATVSDLVSTIGRHYGAPLDLLRLVDAGRDELRTILNTTGVDRFDPARLPARAADEAPAGTVAVVASPEEATPAQERHEDDRAEQDAPGAREDEDPADDDEDEGDLI